MARITVWIFAAIGTDLPDHPAKWLLWEKHTRSVRDAGARLSGTCMFAVVRLTEVARGTLRNAGFDGSFIRPEPSADPRIHHLHSFKLVLSCDGSRRGFGTFCQGTTGRPNRTLSTTREKKVGEDNVSGIPRCRSQKGGSVPS